MSLKDKHPSYATFAVEWKKCRDCYEGEQKIKDNGETYLPATAGMRLDGMSQNQEGYEAYKAYKMRAVYHNFVGDSIEIATGLLNLKPADIKVPASMEGMLQRISQYGETAQEFLLRIYVEQMKVGRIGIMAEVPSGAPANVMPYLISYYAESAINWGDGNSEDGQSALNFVVLDETSNETSGDFKWVLKERFRVLKIIDGVYHFGEFDTPDYADSAMIPAQFRGNILNKIPFVFVNSKDVVSEPEYPPLTTLANICLAIYRGEADYRNTLYLQGQETLVIIGNRLRHIGDGIETEDAVRVGAGSKIEIEVGGDAKYIGVSASGLSEQRLSIDNDKKIAESISGRFLTEKNGVESEGAIRARRSSQTATLVQIATNGAKALERILKICAVWMGANENEVSVTPNLEFTEIDFTPDDVLKLMAARTSGAPISLKTIHDRMREKKLTNLTMEEELEQIESEADLLTPKTPGRGEPSGDNGATE